MASTKHRVKLLNIKTTPLADIISSARTCYSAKGIVLPAEFTDDLQDKDLELISSIYQAGHLTTFQHTQLHFGIENISRNCVWSFLHAHPFHNSEQVSQRYCQVKKTELFMPDGLSIHEESLIGACYENAMSAYQTLRTELLPICTAEYLKRFPQKKATDKESLQAINKRAQEIARYILPLGTSTRLHHSISLLTLFRYAQQAAIGELPLEQQSLVNLMLTEVLEHEPKLEAFIPKSITRAESAEKHFMESLNIAPVPDKFNQEFDAALNGSVSQLVACHPTDEQAIATAIATAFGLNNHQNQASHILSTFLQSCQKLFSQNLNPALHSKLGQCLSFVRYTFRKKLSHTADSQNQRHRTAIGYRPLLQTQFSGRPDYILPALINEDQKLLNLYQNAMLQNFSFIEKAQKQGIAFEQISYMLPNAFPIRFIENIDLAALRHRMSMRLCVNAQDEIRKAAIEEMEQIRKQQPTIANILLTPCQARKADQKTPFCPEGNRFCGLSVWNNPELIKFGLK